MIPTLPTLICGFVYTKNKNLKKEPKDTNLAQAKVNISQLKVLVKH